MVALHSKLGSKRLIYKVYLCVCTTYAYICVCVCVITCNIDVGCATYAQRGDWLLVCIKDIALIYNFFNVGVTKFREFDFFRFGIAEFLCVTIKFQLVFCLLLNNIEHF